ncbi:MAG: hypothetical protein HYX91_04880 [Chloroflexi bacterium]|nr:hypothetical protein [Chloroflexota bacterium]
MSNRGRMSSRVVLVAGLVMPFVLAGFAAPALAAPLISLSPGSGARGTQVELTGTNFESYRGDRLHLFFNEIEIPGSPVAVPDGGNFVFNFEAPAAATPGQHTVRVRNEAGSTLALGQFAVTGPQLRLDVSEGPVGTKVLATGGGFYSGRTVDLYFYDGDREKLATAAAGATGEVGFSFIIPNSAAGSHQVAAENSQGDSAGAVFRVMPMVALNLDSASAGESVTLSGSGFASAGTVNVYFGNYQAASARAGSAGSFDVTFSVPELKPEAYDIRAVDGMGNLGRARLTVTAGASLGLNEGHVGMELPVKGNGFKPAATVVINFGVVQVASAVTDNNGAFSAAFSVPAAPAGRHIVTLSDGSSVRQMYFTVESVPPPAPGLRLPADGSESRARASFDWEDVADPSLPVTYRLQVASDRNFASVIFDRKDLARSDYIFAETERLAAAGEQATYYWRAKAIDAAANESEWSAARALYIVPPATPAAVLPEAGVKAGSRPRFDWQDVAASSPPVTYTLQVGSDERFSRIVMEKRGLAVSEYIPAEDERLSAVRQEAPYYWRVKAVDAAGNESNWSAPRSFYVGFALALPSWLIYVLAGLAALVIAALAFWLGRRTAYYKDEM